MSCPVVNFPTIIVRDCIDLNGTGGGTPGGGASGSVCCGLVIANTLVDLRATPDITGIVAAILFSFVTPGDSAPIFYWWNAASLDADNGISIIKFDITDLGSPGRLMQSGILP